jgi:uncharacterized protein YecT (DUF1311 family)
MIRAFALAVCALLLAVPTADAQGRWPPRSISEEVDRCPEQTNPGMMECAAVALDREDARLNRVYRAALARMKPAQQDLLRREQRRWIRDRDEQCQGELDQGGAQDGIYATICQAQVTRDRADELERMARPRAR